MLLNLTDPASIKTYFSALATSHVDIDSFKYGNEKIIQAGVRTEIKGTVLWCDHPEPVTIRNQQADNYLGQYKATFVIMSKQPKLESDRDTHLAAMEAIARQIIAKMIVDYSNSELAIDINQYNFGIMADHMEGANAFAGIRVDYHWQAPVDITYNEAKWQ